MARGNRTYTRDSRGRFASGGGGGAKSSGGSLSARRSLRQSRAKLAAKDPADRSIKGQLSQRSQKGAVTRANKRLIEAKKASQRRMPAQKRASRISAPAGFKKGHGLKRGGMKAAAAAKPKVGQKKASDSVSSKPDRKQQLIAGAQKRKQQADRIDAEVAAMEKRYRSKDSAFYTQGVKTNERDRMHELMRRAAELREQSKALREKAANAERMAAKIKDKPIGNDNGDARLARAIANEAAGGGGWRKNPRGQRKKSVALRAQKVYRSGDPTSVLSFYQMIGKGFRVPRSARK